MYISQSENSQTKISKSVILHAVGHTPPIIIPIDYHVRWLVINPKYLPFLTLLGMAYVVSFSYKSSFLLKKMKIHTMAIKQKRYLTLMASTHGKPYMPICTKIPKFRVTTTHFMLKSI